MVNALGINIKKIRELKNLGQNYLAEQLGISQSSYSEMENGKTRISEEKLLQIAEILEVNPEAIKNFSDSFIFNSCTQSGYINTQNIMPIDKIQELYERLLKEKDEQISVLKETMALMKSKSV